MTRGRSTGKPRDVVYTHDLQGKFTSVNKAAEDLTGYTSAELLTMNLVDLLAPGSRALARQMMFEKFGGGPPRPYKLVVRKKDGGQVALQVTARLLFARGQPAEFMGSGRVVAARRLGVRARRALRD